MAGDPTWDFQDPACKDRLLDVLRREIHEMFELAADPARWQTPTACPGWEICGMVGHLLDATESYLTGFDVARNGAAPAEPIGVARMAKHPTPPRARSVRYLVTSSSRGFATTPTG